MKVPNKTRKAIIADPAAHFDMPDALLASDGISADDKRLALKSWAEDAGRLSVATDEGMTGGERSLLPEVKAAEGVLETRTKAKPRRA